MIVSFRLTLFDIIDINYTAYFFYNDFTKKLSKINQSYFAENIKLL